jgi:glycosyltransferase involved in cell wall biosynthesis
MMLRVPKIDSRQPKTPKTGLPGTSRFKLALRSLLGIRLGQFAMYSPRPVRIPAHYRTRRGGTGRLKVSIVTPVFNQSAFIAATIESVLSQNYPALEYIIIDGGSSDGTAEIVKSYRDRLFWAESSPDNGQSDAINRGMRYASGDLLAWLNGDDLLLPGALDYVVHFFETHPNIDVLYGHRIVIDHTGKEIGRWVLPPHSDRVLSWVDYIPQETLFWRRKAWEVAGARIDDTFHFAMDWDLLLRLRDSGARFVRVPRFLGAFRVHEKQKTWAEQETLGIPEINRIRERCLGYVPSKAELRLAVIPYILQHILLEQCSRMVRVCQQFVCTETQN